MRRIYFFFLFMLFPFVIKAQMQNLYEMSQGKLQYSKIIFENNSLWGYFYLYELDKMKDSTKMEYIVLDKNLNKMHNGTFNALRYKDPLLMTYETKYENCVLMGNDLVLDLSLYKTNSRDVYMLVHNSNRVFSLKDNTVSEEYIYKYYDKKFIPVPTKALNFSNRTDSLGNNILVDPIHGGGKKGFLVRRFGQNTYTFRNERDIRFYNTNRELKWQYNFDTIPPKVKYWSIKSHKTIEYLFMDSLSLYFIEKTFKKNGKAEMLQLIALDINTGKKTSEYCIQTDSSQHFHNLNVRQFGDTIALYGKYYNNPILKKGTYYNGYYRILIDKNFKEIDKDYRTWQDMSTPEFAISPKSEINKTSKSLSQKSMLLFRDGSMAVANQAYNSQSTVSTLLYLLTFSIINVDKPYEKDLYFINLNKDFEPVGVTKTAINKTEFSNSYLYSQYHANNNAAVACFINRIKVGSRNEAELVINTIRNNEVLTERIPLTSTKKYLILPNPAKDGYIMLNEFNEKDRYNQIRLEKLNN